MHELKLFVEAWVNFLVIEDFVNGNVKIGIIFGHK